MSTVLSTLSKHVLMNYCVWKTTIGEMEERHEKKGISLRSNKIWLTLVIPTY